ncbi:MAG: hypothetical protein J6P07_03160, partial [Spirochaetaceae bacterium]|nr:hypothetical protein [Spirochaetaceae bacterium]
YLKSRKKALRDVENKEKYEARIYKNIKEFTQELKQAQKEKDESQIKFYQGLIEDSEKQLDENERLSLIESFKKDIEKAEQEIKELKASMKKNRNLYTVDIPDEGYVVWEKPLTTDIINRVDEGLKKLEEQKKFYRDMEMSAGNNPWNIQYEEYMKAPENFKGEDLYNYLEKVLHSDKAASLFLKDLGYIGIDYPAHSLAGSVTEDERNYVIFDERNAQITNHLLFQKAYHGSGANFEKFNTEQYGLSGEGSMYFGYGTYVSGSEEIARDYAERQRPSGLDAWLYKGKLINSYPNSFDLKEVIAFLSRGEWDKNKAIQEITELKESYEKSGSKEIAITGRINDLDKLLNILNDKDFNVDDFDLNGKTNLYTIEIPDNGYIVWDKDVDEKTKKYVENAIFEKLTTEPDEDGNFVYKGAERELKEELDMTFGADINGQELYNDVVVYLGDEKAASKFLNKLGFVGIDYPAYSNFGNAMGKSARNYVIFNDEDAKIVDHLLFQTQAELLEEARSFDTWQEFMDFYETMGKPEVTPIPYEADAQWYQSFWETAKGMQTEQEKNEQAVNDKAAREGNLPPAMDALFTTSMRSNPEMLDNFLKMAAWVDAIDFNSEEWKAESEVDAQEREKYERLQDFISFSLSDYNWQTAMKRVRSGNEISEGLRKRLIGEVTDSFKVRDFRALYAELMEDSEYAVAQEDTIAAQLDKKLQKYQKRYYDILKPSEDISRVSPERRKQIAEAMANRDIANKIANGSLKLDDELDNYIKSLEKQTKDAQKRYDELEAETKADYQRIADAERRKLLKVHEELLIARSKLNSRNDEVARKVNKGLKITEKYSKESQNLQANYNELFRKFEDLKNSIQINAEVNAALERQQQLAGLKEDLNAKKKEQNLTSEIKKMRIQLVKRTMRRVPFNRIDYNNAKTVIAIQRILEPNLIGGVNKFIGIDSPYLRGVISQIVTDRDFKEQVLRYLSKSQKSSQAFMNFKKKIEEMKTVDDLNSWTRKEREYAIKHLPKENWIRDLNLESLAQEREESIDLDIGTEEVRKPVIDPETGKQKVYTKYKKEDYVEFDTFGMEHQVTKYVPDDEILVYEVSPRVTFSDEIAQEVRDAVGQDMFDLMVNVPFSEWTTEQLETLAKRIDELYVEGRELLAAKNEARKREAEHLRNLVEDAIKETGITINDDDTPEEKKKKLARISRIVGNNKDLKGTEAGKESGIKARLNRLLHGYADMNVLRFARMLDNNVEGINTRLLYREEDSCFNAKQRSINARTKAVYGVMEANNITEADLAKQIKVKANGLDTSFTVDELLYFLAADKDYELDDKGRNDNYAATSRNAVMFGNMMSDNESQEKKELWDKADKDMKELIENDALDANQRQLLAIGQLDKTPGTTAFIFECNERWKAVIGTAQNFIDNPPKSKALMEAIEGDYASQYERMNEVSINEFNQPVHRVKAYVPLVRRESKGDTNVNQVKEDLLGAFGAEAGKQWVNKGMTQRRQNISPLHQKPVQTGLFATWGSSIERTEHFIAYSPYVRKLNAIYKSRDASYTRRFIEARYGKPAVEYLDSYINEVASPNANKIREKGAEFLHALRGRTAPAYLGWKFSAII